MARITIEDCMEQVDNRFQLVRMASIRAKQLKKGARPLLVSEENKEVVMSLREIAAGLVKPCETDPSAQPTVAADDPFAAVATAAPVETPDVAAAAFEPEPMTEEPTPES